MSDRIVRDVARVVVLDPDDNVLLLQGFDPADPSAGRWWFTPGGGVEPDETFEQAAIRELQEETGLRVAKVEPLPGQRSAVFDFDGRVWEQQERYFTVRVETFVLDTTGWTEGERRSLLGARWWSPVELGAASVRVFPDTLPELLHAAIGVLG
ncbi:MAG TPA: NUDIX domain-containing protein [Pseudolysinimonas sp.]|nr:NUDIX domain-containing protein [Pseudolysinimonas sp.]